MAKKVERFHSLKVVDLAQTKQNVRVKKHLKPYVEVIVKGRKRDLAALRLYFELNELSLYDDADYALPSSTGDYVQSDDVYASDGSIAGISSGHDITLNWDGVIADINAANNININGRRTQSAGGGRRPVSLKVTVKIPFSRKHRCSVVGK